MAIGDKIYNLEINDSEFEREGWKNARYKGSKLIGSQINKFNEGDISFANQPVIEQYSKTVYVFNQAKHSFETLGNNFYPPTDEFGQTLEDQIIVGSSQFTIDRAVTFTVDNPSNFSQIDPGINEDESNYIYFDNLIKTDLATFNSCSVRFFDNSNNGFVKPSYVVGHNRGKFLPAAAFFLSSSEGVKVQSDLKGDTSPPSVHFDVNNGARLYINPNVEEWFTAQTGASGSQGTLFSNNTTGNIAINITHSGSADGSDVNSSIGYSYGLSKEINKDNNYFISFNKGLYGVGTNNEKNILKAFDIREFEFSGSNISTHNNYAVLKIRTLSKDGGNFNELYTLANEQEFILYKRINKNNIIHLNFNFDTEAPSGEGNGGVIIPDNLHPKIKESLNIYLSNAGLGAEGGTTSNFNLGGVTAVSNEPSPTPISSILDKKQTNDDLLAPQIEGVTLNRSPEETSNPNTEMGYSPVSDIFNPNSGQVDDNSSKAGGG
jgi:hypothetical protein